VVSIAVVVVVMVFSLVELLLVTISLDLFLLAMIVRSFDLEFDVCFDSNYIVGFRIIALMVELIF